MSSVHQGDLLGAVLHTHTTDSTENLGLPGAPT